MNNRYPKQALASALALILAFPAGSFPRWPPTPRPRPPPPLPRASRASRSPTTW
ncbi:MAG: hypothetical protein M0D55_20035 [Elusimicrobiota bacterium]|nr:MAG: hypothetical protein M0D55_20035 [Elusimicrobiota bacterium]